MDEEGRLRPERERARGLDNADLFYQGLKVAGPEFTRQKIVDAINKMTNYTAGGLRAAF